MNKLKVLDENQISHSSTQDLKTRLAESLEFTAKHLTYMGMLWRELEQRGEDLSHLKKGMSVYIPMIAYGKIDARLVINYAGQQTLLSALAELDKEEQLKLIENPVVEFFDTKKESTEQKELIDLKASEIHQVFATKKIRTAVEQIKIASKPGIESKVKKRKPRKLTKVEIVGETMTIGGREVDLIRVIDVLEAHYNIELKSLIEDANGH